MLWYINILILSAALPRVMAAFAYKLGFTIYSDFEFLIFGKIFGI